MFCRINFLPSSIYYVRIPFTALFFIGKTIYYLVAKNYLYRSTFFLTLSWSLKFLSLKKFIIQLKSYKQSTIIIYEIGKVRHKYLKISMAFLSKKKAKRKKFQRSFFCKRDFNPHEYFAFSLGSLYYTSLIKSVLDRPFCMF